MGQGKDISLPSQPRFNPMEDGEKHINLYSRGRTRLGRLLSNFEQSRFEHPTLGWFESMEGFYYYTKTGYQHEHLRNVYGFNAKEAGKGLASVRQDGIEEIWTQGLYCKAYAHPDISRLLYQSSLELVHYYWYGDARVGNVKVIDVPSSDWLCWGWADIRRLLKICQGDMNAVYKHWGPKPGQLITDPFLVVSQ